MKNRLSYLSISILTFLALAGTQVLAHPSLAHAATADGQHLTYYGADLNTMTLATGINYQTGAITPGGPWPQYASNYCFTAVVQAITNYVDLTEGKSVRYPAASDEGPLSGDPTDEQAGQILYDMDNYMIPAGGPLPVVSSGANRRPYALSNTAYDFGGDPHTQAVGTAYESPDHESYHEHIFHNGAAAATLAIAQAVAFYQQPVIALVNHAEHSVLVAGVWATGNPLTDPHAQISSLAVYNPWDQSWGTYLSTGNYAQVSYSDWTTATNLPSPFGGINSWFAEPYSANALSSGLPLDPDPSIGIYQAGAGTNNPNATHWIGNYVIIQRDNHNGVSANYSYDENNHLMLQP